MTVTAITNAYDLLKKMESPTNREIVGLVKSLYSEPKEAAEENEIVRAERERERTHALANLQKKLQNLDKAVAALKTTPENEGREELRAIVETLMPVAAYHLSTPGVAEKLIPLFTLFNQIYAEKYSDDALNRLVADGKIKNQERLEFEKTRNQLSSLYNNDMDVADQIPFMQNLLLNIDQHPALLDRMTDELFEYRRHNMGTFNRIIGNFQKGLDLTLKNRAAHTAYATGPERLGVDLGNAFSLFLDLCVEGPVFKALGVEIPLPTDENQQKQGANTPYIPRADGKGVVQNQNYKGP